MSAPEPLAVAYSTVYLWTCPHCDTTWQMRHRPRGGGVLRCKPSSEQRCAEHATRLDNGEPWKGCDAELTSTGRREGVAPNVYC